MKRPLLLGSVLALSLGACGHERPGKETGAAAPGPPIRVRTARVESTGAGSVEVPGTVEAARTAVVASRVAALIEQVTVDEGARVRRGDLLVRLDAADLRARLRAVQAAFEAARTQRDRMRALFGREAATKQELELAETQDAAAEAALGAERAQLAYFDIRAPFDGQVTARMVHPGDLAGPGQALVVLQSEDLLRVAASIAADQAVGVRVGDSLDAVLEDGRRVVVTVSILSPASDPASRRHLLKADLPGGSGARAGSFVRLRVPGGEAVPLVVAPQAALFERGALTGVFVVEEGRARLRWISPGDSRGDAVAVRAGLVAGETIVLDPSGLTDGAAVTPSAPGPLP